MSLKSSEIFVAICWSLLVFLFHSRCQYAALSSETCCCGNQPHTLLVSACFISSLREGTIDVIEGSEKQRWEKALSFSVYFFLFLGLRFAPWSSKTPKQFLQLFKSAFCFHFSPIYYVPLGIVGSGQEGSELRSEGPLFLYMSLSACPEGEQAGRTLGVTVSGKLAGCWRQSTGQLLV